jgi:hypothetical protein
MAEFERTRVDQYLCGWTCKKFWEGGLKYYFVPLTREQVVEHVEHYGRIDEQVCGYIGLTVSEVEQILNG